jgi:hypothetical protein
MNMSRTLVVLLRLGLLALALSGVLGSQAPQMSGPMLGYVFDPALEGLRPIRGIPGAATLGEPLDLGTPIYDAAVSPRQDYALAFAGADRKLALARLTGASLAIAFVPGSWPDSARIILSPTGATAVLYQPSASRLLLITGLPQAPALAGVFDLWLLPGEATALAVSDDGSAVLAAAGGGIFYLGPDGPPQLLSSAGEISSIAFLNGSTDAVFSDRLGSAVYRLRDPAGSREMILLAGERDGIWEPTALALSGDNAQVFIVHRGPASVGIVPAAGGPLTQVACACSPATLQRLDGNSTFRLTEPSSMPLWVLEAAAEPRVVFVPPALRAAGQVW